MTYLVFALFALLLPALAHADTVPIVPPPTHGCATMSVTTTSATISSGNVTLCPNTAAFPTYNGLTLTIVNQVDSTGNIVLCPKGGTCSTVGLKLTAGQSVTKTLEFVTNPPSVVSVSGTQSIYVEW